MMPNSGHQANSVALLSIANVNAHVSDEKPGRDAIQVAGQSVLELQLKAIRNAGCSFFIIEVDNVSGPLLALVDRLRQDGVSIEFARTPNDLRSLVQDGMKLFILAEDHFYSDALMSQLMSQDISFIATLDSRDENSDFERIDLNTRWAGFASLEANVVQTISDLPDDWSLMSSLLRHAIQKKVAFLPIMQANLQNMDIAILGDLHKAERLSQHIIKSRAEITKGWVERFLFAPIAGLLAPKIWKKHRLLSPLRFFGSTCAAVSVGFALFDMTIWALFASLFALFFNYLNIIVRGAEQVWKTDSGFDRLFWLIICISGFAVAHSHSNDGSDPIIFTAMIMGLAVLAQRLSLPRWIETILFSPSLIAIFLIFFALTSAFLMGIKFLMLAQLALLIGGQYLSDRKHVKND